MSVIFELEEVYRGSGYIGETYIDEEGEMKFGKYKSGSFSGERLSNKGAYYDVKSEYINQYNRELQMSVSFVIDGLLSRYQICFK